MGRSIETLVSDIYDRISNPKGFEAASVAAFSKALVTKLTNRLSEERGPGTLRASVLGKPCNRQLWFDVHRSSDREALPAPTRIKFLFGDILEELLLFLAREAGHDVRHEQAEVDIHGVKGHIDGIVDGRLIDCKSTSVFAFEKHKAHKLPEDDPFGYIDQLGGYHYGCRDNPDLVDKDVASFLVIEKEKGHILLDTYPVPQKDYKALVEEKQAVLSKDTPPDRPFSAVSFQKGGNEKIPMQCSYCSFKHSCWSDANEGKGLRTFIYAEKGKSPKPVWLSTVVKEPSVLEVDKDGNRISKDEPF